LKVMSAIEQCRTAALGGMRCAATPATTSRSATTPAATGTARSARPGRATLARSPQADLLPVEYYHVVFTLPEPISALAYTNKAVIYRLLFDVAAETLMTIAADPKHLGRGSAPPWCCTPGARR
jgi:hypothetical protein